MKKDKHGDRMKFYETNNVCPVFPKGVPVMARIDGRSFSKFTAGMDRPFDNRMSQAMVKTTKHLVEHTGAVMGYTQSDEISLVWFVGANSNSEMWFGGKLQKMVSQLAGQATSEFQDVVRDLLPDYSTKCPTFDARVWFLPTKEEAVNAFIWREKDAHRNSVSMAAQSLFSHAELHGVGSRDMINMMLDVGVNWDDYPDFFRLGTYVKRSVEVGVFSETQLASLPPLHAAHNNPELEFTRNVVESLPGQSLFTQDDRVAFIFDSDS